MAHFYNVIIYNCRTKYDEQADGTKGSSSSTRKQFNFAHTNDESDAATGFATMKTALKAAMAKANQHVNKISTADDSAFITALDASLGQGYDDPSDSEEGPYSERIGKDVYAYAIGYSETDAAGAITARVNKDLS